MTMVTIMRPIAISGEISAIVLERSARFSSTNCMRGLLRLQRAAAHQQAEFFARRLAGGERCGQMAMEHHGDAVGDFRELVEVLAGHEHGGAWGCEITQRLPDHGGSAAVDAPGRLAYHQYLAIAQDLAPHDEFLDIAAGERCCLR